MPATERIAQNTASVNPFTVLRESSSHEYLEFPVVDPGSPIKLNKQYYVACLAKGQTIGIRSSKEYPTFFKLFRRYCQSHKLKLSLSVRQTLPDLWLLIPRAESEQKPDIVPDGDWREHGRYKYYAAQLKEGNPLSFDSKLEAQKARRAWMLYTPRDARGDHVCVITKFIKSGKFVVRVQENPN